MARTTKPLSEKQISNAKPKEKPYTLTDGNGLLLKITINGSKLWRFNYSRPFTKKRNEISLGNYPETSLAEARAIRNEYRALLAQNVDPQSYREELVKNEQKRLINTFSAISQQWKEKKKNDVEPRILKKYWRRLELYLFPTLGDMPISEIMPSLAIDALEPLSKQNNGETLKRTIRLLNEVLTFAVLSGVIPFNPCQDVKDHFSFGKTTNNPTIRPEELPDLIKVIYHSNISPYTRNLLFWQRLTMTRPNEASSAEWSEIDFERGLWTLSAEKMKMRKAHVIPLSRQALALLAEMRQFTGRSPYVFQSTRHPSQPMNRQSANKALRDLGYQGRLVFS